MSYLLDLVESEIKRFKETFKFDETKKVDIELSPEELAKYIDQTILKPQATVEEIENFVMKSLKYEFYSFCVPPCYVRTVKSLLPEGTRTKVITVVGFPHGNVTIDMKAKETNLAISDGAEEIDMVINIGFLKSGDYEYVFEDIKSVVEASEGIPVKVIIETCYLTDEEKVAACVLAKEAGASFVKTSTGFGTGGANIYDVSLMKFVVGEKVGVKASGGIRTFGDALKMIAYGATRIGTSRGIEILGVTN
jgi:deoxyribose-phosphate aldolase